MLKSTTDLEKELLKWREARAKKQPGRDQTPTKNRSNLSADRRTVRVNGQEIVVVKKAKRPNG